MTAKNNPGNNYDSGPIPDKRAGTADKKDQVFRNLMITKKFNQLSPRAVLAIVALLSALPIAMVVAFPEWLNHVMAPASYVVFHNIAEFFSVMVSLSIFGVGWYTFDQTKDRHALFLSAAFLVIGLLDFMHTLSNAAMPAFITPNSSNKSTQFWIAVRLFQGSAFLASAFVYSRKYGARLSKKSLLTSALLATGLVFAGVIFFPGFVPDTFVQGTGLTPFKKISEYLVICLLCAALAAYWRQMSRTGDRLLIYYQAAIIISIFGEIAFAVYTRVFDTYNVLGHVYKVAAFALIYKGIFIASVRDPYVKLAVVSVSRDELSKEVEERMKAEAEILKLSEDMAARNVELESANQELESFIYSVSHDLRAPLRSVSEFSRVVAEDYADKLDAQGIDYLSRISKGSAKMNRLIESLLYLSRISRQDILRSSVDMSKMSLAIVSELRDANCDRSVAVEIKEGMRAVADPRLMEVALSNLFGNAWKFTAKTENARIEFGSVEKDGKTVYSVRDNGAGFDSKYADKMFWPFHRLHTQQEFEGTGIGLTIVERVIRRHGGRVWAEGEEGKGATVYFTLG